MIRVRKVAHRPVKDKGTVAGATGAGIHGLSERYDHYVAVDWAEHVMAIGHTKDPRRRPEVFERASDVKELRSYLRSLTGRVILTFEETTSAQWLYLELCDCVAKIIICDPYHNRLLCHGPKTDKIDAGKLCTLLCAGLLKEVFHMAGELYELRRLVSGYEDLVRLGVCALNQQDALHRAAGPSKQGAGRYAPFVHEHLEAALRLYAQQKPAYETKFASLCRRHPLLRAQMELPGIGTISAVKILATVVDAHRFPSVGHYLSYCGLVKHQKFSGGRSYGNRKARYTRTLKCVYKTAVHAALKGDNPLRAYYDALLQQGVAEHNARNACARYLARVSFGMLKTGEHYDPERWRHGHEPGTQDSVD